MNCLMTAWYALVNFSTRGNACLDNIFTNRPDLFGKCTAYTISIKTAHMAVILPVGTKLKPVHQRVRIHDLRKHWKEDFYLALASKSWECVLSATDVDQAVKNSEILIHKHMDRYMPFRTAHMSSCYPE